MKKYICSLLCVLALGITSCDSFLDVQPVGKVIPTSAEEYRALLAQAYKVIPSDRGYAGFRSDEMTVAKYEMDQDTYGFLEIWDDSSIKEGNVKFKWVNNYNVIYFSNQIIENAAKIESNDEAVVNQIVGEAHLLRAYMHYLLVNLHGQPYTLEGGPASKAVPLIWDTDIEKVRTRNTVEEIYTAILKDIESAKELINVEEWENKFSYRFNTTSAFALEARVNLYMAHWQKALDASKEVLKGKYTLADLSAEGALVPNHYTSTENICAADDAMNSNTTTAALVAPSFIEKFAADDLRTAIYFSEPNDDGLRKSKKTGKNEFKTTFRLAEFVLTAAEASAQLNELESARQYLLLLVEKRYTSEGVARVKAEIATLNQKDLLQFIYDERAREFALEGHRWFDLRRTTRPQIDKVIGGKKYTLKHNDPRYTIPIPREATQANPNLLL